ncbi:MAG: hypothetical protein OHK0024_21170 [Thalassobaculales bacterium]
MLALAAACDDTSQSAVARRLGYSASAINQALRRSYLGRLDRLEAAVRARLMATTVTCPLLGEIATARCLDEQQRPFQLHADPLRVQLYRACRACPHAQPHRRS